MALARGKPGGDQILRAVEKDDADIVAAVHENVAIGALQRRAGDDGALAGGRRGGRSRRQSPAATASGPRRSADGRRSSSRRCLPGETCRHPRSASRAVRPDDRRWCSCPSRKRPSPPARKELLTRPRKFSGIAARSTSQTVSPVDRARLAGRFSPAKRRVKIARLSAPATSNSISRQEARVGSVRVTRGTNGSTFALGTPTTQRAVSSSAGSPGNSDAVWPSGPTPISTRSNSGRA